MKAFFDKVYCLNLDRRPDRWSGFRDAISSSEWPFKEPIRVSAIDGQKVVVPRYWHAGAGAWGCYRSHLRVIEDAINEGTESILILEDDALPVEGFPQKCRAFLESLPSDWGMVYLGGQHLKINRYAPRALNEEAFVAFNVNRTHAFGLRGEMLRIVYDHLNSRDWEEKDHIDHHLGKLHEQHYHSANLPKVCCPRDWLFWQNEGKSNICEKVTETVYWDGAALLSADLSDVPFVAIVGLPGSGAAQVGGIAYNLGVHLGNVLGGIEGDSPENGQCGYEAIGLSDLKTAAIDILHQRYRLSRPRIFNRLREWINTKKREGLKQDSVAGGSSSLFCRTGDQLLNICQSSLRVIFVERPLDETTNEALDTSDSTLRSDVLSQLKWLEKGIEDFKKKLDPLQAITIRHSELTEAPAATARRISQFLHLDKSQEEITRSARFVLR